MTLCAHENSEFKFVCDEKGHVYCEFCKNSKTSQTDEEQITDQTAESDCPKCIVDKN